MYGSNFRGPYKVSISTREPAGLYFQFKCGPLGCQLLYFGGHPRYGWCGGCLANLIKENNTSYKTVVVFNYLLIMPYNEKKRTNFSSQKKTLTTYILIVFVKVNSHFMTSASRVIMRVKNISPANFLEISSHFRPLR